MNIEQRYNEWLKNVSDKKVLELLNEMKSDSVKKTNAFFKDLEFGTGGLRGEIGAGTNCLNVYTIAKVTQGIADSMKAKNQKVAAVSYDSRINSDIFAKRVAQVFASNGIKAYITRELMPTPFLSYLTRTVKADIGVMITASHNPGKYNGYKVYGSDGCQLTDAAATEMIGYISKIDPFKVQLCDYDKAVKAGQIIVADDKIEYDYLAQVQKQSLNSANGVSITYTPLNGTGYRLIPEILKRSGVETIHIVEPQSYPDGNFTTCSYPNPEKKEALKLGLELAQKTKTDILIATDPDADRIGIAVLHNGGYELLTGNEVGVLLTDYLFSVKKSRKTLPNKPVMVKTIVTTPLALKIAAEYDAVSYDVLTGFKYIGDVIAKLERNNEENRFILGYEESYGYLSGTYVRDKDAVVAAMLIAEMTAHLKREGKTLVARLNEIYKKYGKYEHRLLSFEYPGAEGNAKMKTLLSDFRKNLPAKIAGKTVVKTIDYLTQTEFELPKADVVSLIADDGTQLIVRPSGTEPLIKLYLTACATDAVNAKTFEALIKQLNEIFQ